MEFRAASAEGGVARPEASGCVEPGGDRPRRRGRRRPRPLLERVCLVAVRARRARSAIAMTRRRSGSPPLRRGVVATATHGVPQQVVCGVDARHPRGALLGLGIVPDRAVGVMLSCELTPAALDVGGRRDSLDPEHRVRITAKDRFRHTASKVARRLRGSQSSGWSDVGWSGCRWSGCRWSGLPVERVPAVFSGCIGCRGGLPSNSRHTVRKASFGGGMGRHHVAGSRSERGPA